MKKFLVIISILSLIFTAGAILAFTSLDLPDLKDQAQEKNISLWEVVFPKEIDFSRREADQVLEDDLSGIERIQLDGGNLNIRLVKGDRFQVKASDPKASHYYRIEDGCLEIQGRKETISYEITSPNPEKLILSGDFDNGSCQIEARLLQGDMSLANGEVKVNVDQSFPLTVNVDNGSIYYHAQELNAKFTTSVDVGSIKFFDDNYSGVGFDEIRESFGQGRDDIQLTLDVGEISVE